MSAWWWLMRRRFGGARGHVLGNAGGSAAQGHQFFGCGERGEFGGDFGRDDGGDTVGIGAGRAIDPVGGSVGPVAFEEGFPVLVDGGAIKAILLEQFILEPGVHARG
jgi:hypothetical protein